jgi:hypothetical protein
MRIHDRDVELATAPRAAHVCAVPVLPVLIGLT